MNKLSNTTAGQKRKTRAIRWFERTAPLRSRPWGALGTLETLSSAPVKSRPPTPKWIASSVRFSRIWASATARSNATHRLSQKDPNNAEAHLQLAMLALTLQRHQDSVEHSKTAAELFRHTGDTDGLARSYWQLGWAYYVLGDWNNSFEASSETLRVKPDLAPVHFNLGLVLLQLGRLADARKHYETGISTSDQVADLKAHAIDDLRDALAKNPNLLGGAQILAMLENKYDALSRDLATSAHQSTA